MYVVQTLSQNSTPASFAPTLGMFQHTSIIMQLMWWSGVLGIQHNNATTTVVVRCAGAAWSRNWPGGRKNTI